MVDHISRPRDPEEIPGGELSVPRVLAALLVVFLTLLGSPGRAQDQGPGSAGPVHPRFHWSLDAPLPATGLALLVIGSSFDVTRRSVPTQGLDPDRIHWSLDRKAVRKHSTRADKDSDYFRDAAVAYPMLLAFLSQPPGARVGGTLRRSFMYSESILVAEGLCWFVKNSADRPRPFTYLPADQRPNDPAFHVTSDEAFRSMPSGHATLAFCAAGFAISDHLISRPEASWRERAGVALVGGFLAGMTAGLRVQGGQHFPSDAMVGGLIGTASGVAIPLAHHYVGGNGRRAPLPAARAWWQAFGGEIIGVAAGLLAAKLY